MIKINCKLEKESMEIYEDCLELNEKNDLTEFGEGQLIILEKIIL